MEGIIDFVPIISIILFAVGLVGVMVYEKFRSKQTEEPTTWSTSKNKIQISWIWWSNRNSG